MCATRSHPSTRMIAAWPTHMVLSHISYVMTRSIRRTRPPIPIIGASARLSLLITEKSGWTIALYRNAEMALGDTRNSKSCCLECLPPLPSRFPESRVTSSCSLETKPLSEKMATALFISSSAVFPMRFTRCTRSANRSSLKVRIDSYCRSPEAGIGSTEAGACASAAESDDLLAHAHLH